MIRIENLSVAFDGPEVVKNVTLELRDGEILGVVGESGCGKSVTALTLMGLVSETARVTSGRILFDDVTLLEAGKPRDKVLYRSYQGDQMSMIFQEPMTSLNPTQRVGRQVDEVLRLHTKLTPDERKEKVLESFQAVGLKEGDKVYSSYPHQLSGGMRQRVMIAMAVILKPRLLVADEPTTALDVTIQNQIIALLREINEKQKNAMLFITHDLNLARKLCHRVAVMKDGCVVEQGETEQIFENPAQDYTRKLIEAVPSRVKKHKALNLATGIDEPVMTSGATNISHRGVLIAENHAVTEAAPLETAKPEAPKSETAQSEAANSEAAKPEIANSEAMQSASTQPVLTQPASIAPVVQVRDLSVYYQDGSNSLFGRKRRNCVVKGADFALYPGESLGLVGESGCGKTTLSKAMLGMIRDIEGQVVHNTVRPQMIFQDPYSSLNPTKTVGWLLQEPLRARGAIDASLVMSKADMEAAAYDMLHRVGMKDQYFHRKPSQLSGGQRQRVSIAQALITNPGFIIADEPVSALDVTIQAQIMELMQKLQQEMKLAYLFISHDINVVYKMCDRIMVMKDGEIIEIGDTEEIFRDPKEEYTKLLFSNS